MIQAKSRESSIGDQIMTCFLTVVWPFHKEHVCTNTNDICIIEQVCAFLEYNFVNEHNKSLIPTILPELGTDGFS